MTRKLNGFSLIPIYESLVLCNHTYCSAGWIAVLVELQSWLRGCAYVYILDIYWYNYSNLTLCQIQIWLFQFVSLQNLDTIMWICLFTKIGYDHLDLSFPNLNMVQFVSLPNLNTIIPICLFQIHIRLCEFILLPNLDTIFAVLQKFRFLFCKLFL